LLLTLRCKVRKKKCVYQALSLSLSLSLSSVGEESERRGLGESDLGRVQPPRPTISSEPRRSPGLPYHLDHPPAPPTPPDQPDRPPGLPYRDDVHQPLRPTLSGRRAPTTPTYCIKPARTVSACNKGNEDPSAHCSFRARRVRVRKSSFYFSGSFNDA